jgi:carbon storage regulator CsrA|tara:strand:+ start:374 stop:577 length:204 start_codon:yes stop_codon:yes gene_type:complete
MLVLSRKRNQRIFIDCDQGRVEILLCNIKKGVAKIGINASKNFIIGREDRKREQFDPDGSISHCDAG